MSQIEVREALLNTIETLKNNSGAAKVVFKADTEWIDNTLCRSTVRDFDPIMIDEPAELGGKDSAINPVELVLVALGGCQEIMYSAYSAVMGIQLDSVTVNAKGYLNLQGLFGLDEDVASGFNRIVFETEISSPADKDQLLTLIETVENHCPVLDILLTQQQVSGTTLVNGKSLASFRSDAA